MILYNTKYLQLKSTKSPSGKDWVYAHRPNASGVVVILHVLNKEKILFLIEQRPPLVAENIAKYSVALPAGLVGDERIGESTEDAIKAELLEETGLTAERIVIKTKKTASSPGCVSECVTIAIAYINNENLVSHPVNDGGIIVDRKIININEIGKWLEACEKQGMALTASTLAALYYLKEEDL